MRETSHSSSRMGNSTRKLHSAQILLVCLCHCLICMMCLVYRVQKQRWMRCECKQMLVTAALALPSCKICIVKFFVCFFVSEMLWVNALLITNPSSSVSSIPRCCSFPPGEFLIFFMVLTRTRSAIQQVVHKAPLNLRLSVQNPVELDRKPSSFSHQAAFPSKLLFPPRANEVLVCKSSNLHACVLFNFTASWVALITSRHSGPSHYKSNRRFWRCGTLCWLKVFCLCRLLEVSCVITVAKIIKITLQNKDFSSVVLNINLIALLFCGHAPV